jgi:putative phosphoesterase
MATSASERPRAPHDAGPAGATRNVLLLADTHLRNGQAERLLARLGPRLDEVDVIVHAGDITDLSVLDALAQRAPAARILAVKGNNDTSIDLPERVEADVDGCRIGVVHDSGRRQGRGTRLRAWFPTCDLVVFGHSHLPWHEVDISPIGHQQHQVNPGSAMLRRQAPTCTIAEVIVRNGAVADVTFVPVG